MSSHTLSVLTAAGVACAAALFAMPSAGAAPPSDGKGYLDSTARCTSPDVAVAFGSTASSRVAICRDTSGQYEYRGVRVSDGARLILPASPTGAGGFVAKKDGVSYTVTSAALEVTAGDQVLRDEKMLDFHGDTGSAAAAAPAAPPASAAPTTTATVAPPIDPLPAEVGGSGRTR